MSFARAAYVCCGGRQSAMPSKVRSTRACPEPGHGGPQRVAHRDGGGAGQAHQTGHPGSLADDGARPGEPVRTVCGERRPEVGVGRRVVGENDCVLDGLIAALSEAGRHGVGAVADQDGPASVECGQRVDQMVHIVAEDLVGFDGGDDPRDRIVPRAEAAQQLGLLVVGGSGSGGGDRGCIRVDPAVLERLGAPERLSGATSEGAAAPGLVRGEGLLGRGDDDAPGGEAGVRRPG